MSRAPAASLPFQATTASCFDQSRVRVTRKPYSCEMNFCAATVCALVTASVAVGCVGAACVAGLLPDEPQPAAATAVAMAISASGSARLSRMPPMFGAWEMKVYMRPPDGGGRGAHAAGGIREWVQPAPPPLQVAFRPLTALAARSATAVP